MPALNYGVCNQCKKRVPLDHVIRDGRVFVRKDCPDCGITEALVSTDAGMWRRKREVCHYDPDRPISCTLQCESCARPHKPRMVFVDVTNRCNMNCPICIANIPGMGFEFHPPFSYFEKVLGALAKMEPKPLVQLFGGEPTVRKDIFEIIDLGRRLGLDLRIVTNGLKLADEEFCKRICDAKVHVLLAFDGKDPEIYARLRKNPSAYEKKLKALENLKKYSKHKNTIMCCVARKINDKHMRGLIDFCHENRACIKCMHMIPLTETWEEGEFETDIATTTEDVEKIIDEAFPGERAEFLPAGITEHMKQITRFFGGARLKFGGVHPNCESATYLFSDGERYHPIGSFLKEPLDELAEEFVAIAQDVDPRLARLNEKKWLDRQRGRLSVIWNFGGLLLGALDSRSILKGNRVLAGMRILGGLIMGERLKDLLRKHTNVVDMMLMVVLPFEEYHSIESARLQDCFAAFAYEDPDTGKVETLPVCIWGLYKNDIQRRIAAKYEAVAAAEGS